MIADRVLNRELFLNILDLEVKRAKRYQNFFSILTLKLSPLPGCVNGDGLKPCWKILRDLLTEELRESDIFSFLGSDQWAVIIPYADSPEVGLLRLRLMGSLQYCEFRKKGYEIMVDLICFPKDGTNTAALVGKL